MFVGALLGGFLINKIPAWIFISSIPFVFLISGILRLLVSLLLLPTLKEARLIEFGIGHSFFHKHLTIKPSEGIVYEVIGKYHKIKDKIKQKKDALKRINKQKTDDNENETYTKKLLKFIGKNISPKKEQKDITNMHEIEEIAEEIEKGKVKK